MNNKNSSKNSATSRVRHTIDRERYVPFYLNTVANKMSRGASRIYLREFGIGIIEWAMLSFLSIESGRTAQQMSEEMSLDKAAVSRNLKSLVAGGYVSIAADPDDSRKRTLSLTRAGVALHDRVIEVALARQDQLLADFSDAEKGVLIGFLRRMYDNLSSIDDQIGSTGSGESGGHDS